MEQCRSSNMRGRVEADEWGLGATPGAPFFFYSRSSCSCSPLATLTLTPPPANQL